MKKSFYGGGGRGLVYNKNNGITIETVLEPPIKKTHNRHMTYRQLRESINDICMVAKQKICCLALETEFHASNANF